MRIELTDSARRDGSAAYHWIASHSPERADAFEQRIAEVSVLLLDFPRVGSVTRSGFRKFSLSPYKFALVYEIVDDTIVVHAVAPLERSSEWL